MSRQLPSPGDGDQRSDLVSHPARWRTAPPAHMSVAAQHELPHFHFHFHDSQISHA